MSDESSSVSPSVPPRQKKGALRERMKQSRVSKQQNT